MYKGAMIPIYRFTNAEKHGIYYIDENYHDFITIEMNDCEFEFDIPNYMSHYLEVTQPLEVQKFSVKKFSRYSNHIVNLMDKWTIYGRIERDDPSIADVLDEFTQAQIADFIKVSTEKGSVNCTAILMEYKHKHFGEDDIMDEFSLDD